MGFCHGGLQVWEKVDARELVEVLKSHGFDGGVLLRDGDALDGGFAKRGTGCDGDDVNGFGDGDALDADVVL